MCAIPQVHKHGENQNELCLFKIVTAFKRAGHSVIQESMLSSVKENGVKKQWFPDYHFW